MKKKMTVLVAAFVCGLCAFADVTVSDVQVFSGHPWKEVLIGYTVTGKSDKTLMVGLVAEDMNANKIYAAKTLIGAKVTEGRHVMRWNAVADGANFSSMNVVFTVSLVSEGVQLWKDGPYWAECNVGATKPEEYGYYFWWGDTVGYKRNAANNGWISVKDGSSFSFDSDNCPTEGMDYSQLQSAGYIDSTGNLVPAHDAATAHFGASWRMPTESEIRALASNCDTTWTMRNGVWGRLVMGRGAFASKSIFFPASGYGNDSYLYGTGSSGHCWSSTTGKDRSDIAYSLSVDSRYFSWGGRYRASGQSVRPLRGFAQ